MTASFEEIGKNVITSFLCIFWSDNLVWGPFFEILTLMNTTMKKDFPKIYHFQKIPKIIRRRFRPPKLFTSPPLYHGAKTAIVSDGCLFRKFLTYDVIIGKNLFLGYF